MISLLNIIKVKLNIRKIKRIFKPNNLILKQKQAAKGKHAVQTEKQCIVHIWQIGVSFL